MVGRKVAEMDSLIDKVRQGLECHKDEIPGVCRNCPYFTESGFCSGRLAKDAIAMLKQQEAEIAFLKAKLQPVHNMSNEDIGNAVRSLKNQLTVNKRNA